MSETYSPLTWNANRTTIDARTKRTKIAGAWQNFLKRNQAWAPIDTSIQSDRSVTAFPGCVQLPIDSQGWSEICIDGTYSMKRHIDEGLGHNAEPEFSMSMAVETQHNVTGHISDSNPAQVIYPGAWDSADLKLGIWRGRSARIEKVVDIHTMPSGDSDFVEYSFLLRSVHARVFAGPNHDARPWTGSPGDQAAIDGSSVFLARTSSLIRGAVLRTPVAWYYAGGEMVVTPVRVTFEIQGDGETVRATKHIPRTLIANALANGSHLFTDATFNPDANPETNSVDGYTRAINQNLSWSAITALAAQAAYDSNSSDKGCWNGASGTTDQYAYFSRSHYLFDTSSIGSGQTVDSASLDINVDKTNGDDLGLSWNIYATNPASNNALVAADHSTVGTTPFSTARTIVGESTSPTTIAMTLNSDGKDAIDVEGMAKFAVATQEDRENGTYGDPTWSSGDFSTLTMVMSETTGSNIPELTVTHSSAAAPDSPAAMMLL